MEEEHAGVAAPRPARALPGRPSSFRSDTYKMLFPQLPCFESDPSFMGGVPRGCTPGVPLITARFFPLQKDSSVSATQHRTPLVGLAPEPDDRSTVRSEARPSRVAVGRREPKQNIM